MVENIIKGKLKDETQFFTVFPSHIVERFYIENIEPLVEAGEVSVAAEEPPETPWYVDFLPTIMIILIFVIFWVVFMRQSQGGSGGRVMSFW